jgi:prepilin-type N-terminal cleavage/methylation domain-containing protein
VIVSQGRGFTLVEMLVVLVLISISVALVYPAVVQIRDRFDATLELASADREKKKESFMRFVTDGLPQKVYSSVAAPQGNQRKD